MLNEYLDISKPPITEPITKERPKLESNKPIVNAAFLFGVCSLMYDIDESHNKVEIKALYMLNMMKCDNIFNDKKI